MDFFNKSYCILACRQGVYKQEILLLADEVAIVKKVRSHLYTTISVTLVGTSLFTGYRLIVVQNGV